MFPKDAGALAVTLTARPELASLAAPVNICPDPMAATPLMVPATSTPAAATGVAPNRFVDAVPGWTVTEDVDPKPLEVMERVPEDSPTATLIPALANAVVPLMRDWTSDARAPALA